METIGRNSPHGRMCAAPLCLQPQLGERCMALPQQDLLLPRPQPMVSPEPMGLLLPWWSGSIRSAGVSRGRSGVAPSIRCASGVDPGTGRGRSGGSVIESAAASGAIGGRSAVDLGPVLCRSGVCAGARRGRSGVNPLR